jgi:tape measure domain-containing protein
VSVVANVAINVDSRDAVSKLRQVQQGAQATSQAVDKLNATNDALAASFTKSGKPIQTAANGMRYFVDATGRARKENGQFVTTAEAAAAGLQKQGKAAQQAGASVSNFGSTIRGLIGSFAAIQAAKFVFVSTAEIETQTRSLQVLTGSAEKAGQIIKELQQLGAVTPFTSTELIDSAKRLQAFGIEAENVVETTKRLADVSGATGAELSGLVTAYGQVQAKGRLQGEELLQFQERGVALQTELRKMYGLSGEEFQKALEKGRIGAEAVEVAIIRLTNAGGKYANGAIAQSDTLQGKFSTLQDSIQTLAQTIGKTLAPAFKSLMDQATDAIGAIQRMFDEAGSKEREAQFARNADAAVRAMNLNPFTQQGMMYEMRQRNIEQQRADYELRRKTAAAKPNKPTATPATPALLAGTEKEKRGRQLSVEDLIGGDIQRKLQEQQAKLTAATAKMMNVAAASENPQQAQRMVEYSSKLLGIKYQIAAADETIIKREGVRAQLIASATDKAQAALAFDEGTNDLKAARRNLEIEIDTLLTEQTGKAEEQYRQQQEAIADALAGLDMQRLKVSAVTDAQKQALQVLEIENALRSKGITLTDEQRKAIGRNIAEIQKLTKEQEAANAKLQMEKDLYDSISGTIAGAFSGAIDAAVKGTESLGDALKGLAADVAATIGKMLIMYGIAQALGALGGSDGVGVFSFLAKGFGFKAAKDGAYWPGGFQAFADGGMVTKPTMGLIGEGGEPEYVIPASKMRGAMSRYAAGTRGSAVIPSSGSSVEGGGVATATMEPIDVRYSIERINNVDYVTADQFQRGMAQAAQQGAIQGERRAMRSLKNSAATRRGVGI